jgi:signal peptidase II
VQSAKRDRWLVPTLVALAVLLADQASKQWVLQELGPQPLVKFKSLIGDWFQFVYSQNTGVAFNLFQGGSSFFIVTSLLISAGIIYVFVQYLPNHSPFIQVSIGLILGGALGNTIDRIRLGFVVDFVKVGWWPIFNVADSAITCGAVVLMAYVFLAQEEQPEPEPPRDDTLLSELLQQDVPEEQRPTP